MNSLKGNDSLAAQLRKRRGCFKRKYRGLLNENGK